MPACEAVAAMSTNRQHKVQLNKRSGLGMMGFHKLKLQQLCSLSKAEVWCDQFEDNGGEITVQLLSRERFVETYTS